MCGIFGIFGMDHVGKSDILACIDTIAHRGPDDFGIHQLSSSQLRGWLGHRRLSIQDTSSAGHQPMHLGERYSIVFNGEIYNFKELADELSGKGIEFHSRSDTEVILRAYETWGKDCLQKFNGMFALAIVDNKHESIFLARDRIGIKPLYYYLSGDKFGFSSELKALINLPGFDRQISQDAFVQYLQWQYIPAPLSIFENVFKLPQGSCAYYQNGRFEIEKWWNPHDFFHMPKLSNSLQELKARAGELLDSSVKYRMISDVPVGCFLSGGIDSSLVSSTMASLSSNQIKTFSIGVENKELNEADFAREIAQYLGTEHHEKYITNDDLVELIPQIPRYWDEPFSDSSAIPTMLVSKLARENVTVVLSGDGGDELYGGYYRYGWMNQLHKIGKMPVIRDLASVVLRSNLFSILGIGAARRFKKAGATLTWDRIEDQYRCLSNIWYRGHLENLLSTMKTVSNPTTDVFSLKGSVIERLMLADIETYMVEDILVKVDRASMSTSLEARVPLLDHRFVELALQIPMEYKIRGNQTKFLLRELLRDRVPENLWNRPKAGFEIPIKHWLVNELHDWLMDLFSKKSCDSHGLIQYEELQRLLNDHKTGKYDYGYQLWTLAMFQSWYKTYMD